MADGELTLRLDDDTSRRLKAAAEAAGQGVDDFVADLIQLRLREGDNDATEDLRILEEYRRTGESYSVQEAKAYFHAELMTQVDKSR